MNIANNSASLRIVDPIRLLGALCLAWAALAAALLIHEALARKVKGGDLPGFELMVLLPLASSALLDTVLPITGGYASAVHQKLCEEAAVRIREILPKPRV